MIVGIHETDTFHTAFLLSISLPLSVSRYFYNLLLGLSGTVLSRKARALKRFKNCILGIAQFDFVLFLKRDAVKNRFERKLDKYARIVCVPATTFPSITAVISLSERELPSMARDEWIVRTRFPCEVLCHA
jgi:hypothetical protein